MNRKTVTVNGNEVMLKIDSNLFGKMAVITQTRQLDMKSVMQYELVPSPWCLVTSGGLLRKTNKSSLAISLEKLDSPVESVAKTSACIIDGMSLVQKIQGNHKIYRKIQVISPWAYNFQRHFYMCL